ncbi:MAG TPA: 6,7-dimethyl-8-ribityllumazine synthase [Thermoanaerobaculia bacterium]|jgi:6,7-dimethyl-8-ribityllumazine synthase|nr:6,7-dimethyl-8-ribityllumazine synthase [Thermoanaerobaculia bacterium]HPA50506.1 6,7-dimethyl-8-ribityllumazine synthase [Thermoanaerobaculia bacterium]HQN07067.1 6,7-dimethyl-8-ribityllumazine synthase [Thermoanaerobaculia bacterium]HQP85188.1 6,7-dimethyl-8-ribityllumazine synthase [Thermoanaerobaculia bacterium]
MNVLEGQLRADGRRFGIVASRTNDIVVSRLLDGALDAFRRLGAAEGAVTVVKVPGSWEVPLALRDLARSGGFDALVALGAVIRGGTPHFDYVATEVAKGVFQVGLELDLPITFGVLTCDSLEQALERSGAKGGNKGFEAATAAVELADLRARLRAGAPVR